MNFGFSAGDFIAAISLIREICRALSDVQGARAGFRAAVAELKTLEDVLESAKDAVIENQRRKKRVLRAVRSCQTHLSEFLLVVRKYHPHLRKGGSGNKAKDLFMKIQWSLLRTEDLRQFRAQLQSHLSAIQTILQTENL